MGYLPQGHFGLIRPNPSTSAVSLTWAPRFRPPNKTKSRRGRCKGDGWEGADRNRPPPSPRRRRLIRIRPAGGGGLTWPRGAMGYLPQGHFGLIRPNPPTSAVPLTCARGFGHRIKRKTLAARCKG